MSNIPKSKPKPKPKSEPKHKSAGINILMLISHTNEANA